MKLLSQRLSAAITPESCLSCCALWQQSEAYPNRVMGSTVALFTRVITQESWVSCSSVCPQRPRGGKRAAWSWCRFVPEQRFSLLTVTWLRNAEQGGVTVHSNKGRFQHIHTSTVLYVSRSGYCTYYMLHFYPTSRCKQKDRCYIMNQCSYFVYYVDKENTPDIYSIPAVVACN